MRRGREIAFLWLVVITLATGFGGLARSVSAATQPLPSHRRAAPFVPPAGWPKVLYIPRLGVTATIESVAYDRPEDSHAPFNWGDVAWYNQGFKPGQQGHAVIFGHLDSTCCPAVFYLLHDLHPGDVVEVQYKTGPRLRFRVMWQQSYLDKDFPTKSIFSAAPDRGLMLVTCTGDFHLDGSGYDRRRVVYTRLILPNGHLG